MVLQPAGNEGAALEMRRKATDRYTAWQVGVVSNRKLLAARRA